MRDAAELARETGNEDPEVGLRAVAGLRDLIDELETQQVQSARSRGWTWQRIAAALGVTKQAVHKKHGRRPAGP